MACGLTLWAHSPHGAKRGASFAEVPVVTSEACSEANTSNAKGVSSPVSEPDPGVGWTRWVIKKNGTLSRGLFFGKLEHL